MKIERTTNYRLFEHSSENRGLIRTHINQIKDVIRRIGFHVPVITKKLRNKLIIVDGQQRFEALKELGRPIDYINVHKSVDAFTLMVALNSKVKKWALKDYLKAFCVKGLREYHKLARYTEDTGIAISAAISILNRTGYTATTEFKNGLFKITKNTRGTHFKKYIRDYSNHLSFATRSRFLQGLIIIYESGNYNHGRMIDKMKFYSSSAHTCDKPIEYALMLQNIYNMDEDRNRHTVFVR